MLGRLVLGFLLSVLGLAIATPAAEAITSDVPTEATVGESFTATFTLEGNQPYYQWRITLPTGWTFNGTPTWVPPAGSPTRSCSAPAGNVALCPPAANNGPTTWLAGSRLTATIQIPASAAPGTHEVRSDLGDTSSAEYENDAFPITIQPPAPQIQSPADGASTTDRTPAISGTARAGATVTLTVDGTDHTVTADSSGAWSWTGTDELDFGAIDVSATQTVNGVTSESDTSSFTILPGEPTIDSPGDGGSTTDRTPEITGTAEPGATVTVSLDGVEEEVTADSDGAWTFTPGSDLSYGNHDLSVTQTVNGAASGAVTSSFTVQRLDPPTIDSPADGASTTDRTPEITGTAEPGATVTVTLDSSRRTVTAGSDGTWTSTPGSDLSYGSHDLSVTQALGANVSEPVTSSFTVTEPVTPPPTQEPSPPPTQEPTQEPTSAPSSAPTAGPRPTVGPTLEPVPPPTSRPTSAAPSSQPSSAPPEDDEDEDDEQSPAPTAPAPSGSEAPASPGQIPVSLSFSGAQLQPGQVARMTGVLGPNGTDDTLQLEVSGRMGKGALYRTADLSGGACTTGTTTFQCRVSLPPGASSTMTLRILPDAVSAPDTLVQQITVIGGPGGPQSMTSTTKVDTGPTDTQTLADQISNFPGPTVVTLALFLFALAATVAERRN